MGLKSSLRKMRERNRERHLKDKRMEASKERFGKSQKAELETTEPRPRNTDDARYGFTHVEEPKDTPLIQTKCPSITNRTEIKTCKHIMQLYNNPMLPKNVIRAKVKEGMSTVISKLRTAGETDDFIAKFYWDITEFRTMWEKLGYTEGDWTGMLR